MERPKIMEDYCEISFKVYWGFANGMLGGALVMLGNAMIFHDLPNLASCFIHLTPCSVTWTMRWFGSEINKAYPGIFCLPSSEKTSDSFDDILFPTLKFYFIWLAIYSMYMIPYGIHLGSSNEAVKNGQWDTAYAYTIRNVAIIQKVCGKNPASLSTYVNFMSCHAISAMVLCSLSFMLWNNFYAHTAYCMVLFMIATYNGSVRYVNMMTKWY
jgi:hypothetical protein